MPISGRVPASESVPGVKRLKKKFTAALEAAQKEFSEAVAAQLETFSRP
jgi:hypothetical protein